MELFNIRIPRVSGLVDLGLVPGDPSSSPRYAVDRDGRRWIRKREEDSGPPEFLAEAISWLLGTALGAPIPDVGVCLDDGERSWLSQHVRDTKHWDPDLADLVTNYDGLGRVLAVDAIVINEDRHAGNLLVEPVPDTTSVRIWGIDFGVAVVGYPLTYAARRGELPSIHNHARGLPLRQAWEPAIQAAELASGLESSQIRSFVVEACEIAREKDVGPLFDTLVERCRNAPALVAGHLSAIAKLR